MTNRHIVGRMTDFGKLVAEATMWKYPTQTVAMYEVSGESPYMVIIWDISNESSEFELNRTYHANSEEALEIYLNHAFQVSL